MIQPLYTYLEAEEIRDELVSKQRQSQAKFRLASSSHLSSLRGVHLQVGG